MSRSEGLDHAEGDWTMPRGAHRLHGCVRWSPISGHDELGVCLGDGQTEAEIVPSQGGRGDALLRRMLLYDLTLVCVYARSWHLTGDGSSARRNYTLEFSSKNTLLLDVHENRSRRNVHLVTHKNIKNQQQTPYIRGLILLHSNCKSHSGRQ